MGNITRHLCFYCIAILVLACKSDEPLPGEIIDKGIINKVFESPVRLNAEGIYASMDGKYIVALEVVNTGANGYSRLYVSKNAGESWEEQSVPIHAQNGIHITNNGQIYFSRGNSRFLYDLKTSQEIPINYSSSISQWDDFVLGDDDFIYLERYSGPEKSFRRLSESNWTDFSLSGTYCGQDPNTGGAAFYDPILNELHIHNPADNSITTHSITINVSLVSEGPYQSNRPPRYIYSGSNYFAIAYTKGIAVQNLISGEVHYTDWNDDFKGHYLNPVSITIDAEGEAFASLTYYERDETIRISNGNLVSMAQHVGNNPVSRGQYTYFRGALRLIRQSKNGTDEFETSYSNRPTAEWANMLSARIVGQQKYVLLSVMDIRAKPIAVLHTYNQVSGRFDEVHGVAGDYGYIYSDGSEVYVYGESGTAYSPDNGDTWLFYENELSGVVKTIKYVVKSGNTYFGLATINYTYYNLSTGQSQDRHKVSTYRSTDAINWIEIASSGEHSGKAPQAMTVDGKMMYSSFDALEFSQYTSDFGLSWNSNNNNVPFFNASSNDRLYALHGGLEDARLVIYDNQFNILSDITIENATEAETLLDTQNVHVSESDEKIHFISWKYFLESTY